MENERGNNLKISCSSPCMSVHAFSDRAAIHVNLCYCMLCSIERMNDTKRKATNISNMRRIIMEMVDNTAFEQGERDTRCELYVSIWVCAHCTRPAHKQTKCSQIFGQAASVGFCSGSSSVQCARWKFVASYTKPLSGFYNCIVPFCVDDARRRRYAILGFFGTSSVTVSVALTNNIERI